MPHLHELLVEHEESLRRGWDRSLSRKEGAASASAADEGFSSLFTQLVSALRVVVSGGTPAAPGEPDADETSTTGLDAVVAATAFGLLHERILEIAAERGIEVSLAEHVLLASSVSSAIARAAARQQRKHERELHRMAHKLRNPLGSAMMALTLLRSRVDLGESARLADMAERNLKKLEGLIDESVEEGESTPSEAT